MVTEFYFTKLIVSHKYQSPNRENLIDKTIFKDTSVLNLIILCHNKFA